MSQRRSEPTCDVCGQAVKRVRYQGGSRYWVHAESGPGFRRDHKVAAAPEGLGHLLCQVCGDPLVDHDLVTGGHT